MPEQVDEEIADSSNVLVAVLRALRGRSDDLGRVLDGRALRMSVTLTDVAERPRYRVMFTSAGNVLLLGPGNLVSENLASEEGYDPHVEVRCSSIDLRRLVLGDLPLSEAVERGVVVAHRSLHGCDALLRLLAEESRGVLTAPED